MERNGDCLAEDKSHPDIQVDGQGQGPVLTSNFVLDHAGEVVLTLNSNGLSWNLIEFIDKEHGGSSCLGIKLGSKSETAINFSDVYAVDFIGWGLVQEPTLANARGCLLGHGSEMYRFTVHGVQRSMTQPSLWAPSVYTFGHKDMNTCQVWVDRITASLNMELGRPKSLLVFVHPKSGKGNGCRTWEAVAPVFSRAKVKTKVIVTQRAGHAFDLMFSLTNRELNTYDGVVAVGGDGFFNEILNGLLSSRFKAPYPPAPADFVPSVENDGCVMVRVANEIVAGPSESSEDNSPLLPRFHLNESRSTKFRATDGCGDADKGPEFSLPNKWFRFGIIPAGSTDAIVICTTGTRDPMTSALHIVLGKRVRLDIAQVVRWKTTSTSTPEDEPCVRYAASFAGYGFYGDVITESEKYRWMGPKRYDYAGTLVFLRHRSYEAEIAYLEVNSEKTSSASEKGLQSGRKRALWGLPKKSERKACHINCDVCDREPTSTPPSCHLSLLQNSDESRWMRSKGRFLSVGAAVISCRNERAPDGLVADAHLADGFLHLLLIKECPHALYLWHLTQLARKGGNPLNFDFVEHHKTPAFTFTSIGKESVWNLDGELFQAHQLSAQVFRGLVSLFASGPEV
ncbi:LOW QUALITY PROTEIN: ceramide kinase [Actinidia eriantha]|uniref:LOW QUALITY PROTEIN: ceramide kinase n=1 Tax=Actinidia eriantha TaxID=165200 RepID=UPI002582A1BB|nr:LOW QUALITY PROTEIN: ceramide kinase [Actinidia eriantha]